MMDVYVFWSAEHPEYKDVTISRSLLESQYDRNYDYRIMPAY